MATRETLAREARRWKEALGEGETPALNAEWDAEGAASSPVVLAAIDTESDYEAWDVEGAAVASPLVLAAAGSEAAYEAWDADSGLYGTIALPDFAAAGASNAIASRDDSEDYADEIDGE